MTRSDIETAQRVVARAKRIKRRRFWGGIDRLIKKRMYLIITVLIISIGFNVALIIKDKHQLEVNINNTKLMNKVLVNLQKDQQMIINEDLVHIIDSLQVMVFAYNLQYQEQLKTIQVLTETPPKKIRYTPKNNIIVMQLDTIINDTIIPLQVLY